MHVTHPLAALFDLDGTLIDSIGLIESSFRHTMAAHTARRFDRDEWLAGLGRPLRWQFEQWSSDPELVLRLIATYREHNNVHHDTLVKPYAGAIEAVRDLRQRGVCLGVVTSKLQAGAQRGLKCGGFAGLFDVVIGCDDVREPKPAAEPAELALQRLGAGARGSFMVGDSPHDISCGRSAGTHTAGVLWGPFPRHFFAANEPDRWLEHPREIAGLLA